MGKKNKKIELLAPVGNYEKLEIAIHYGADAVYLAGKDFSLRNYSENFSLDELKTAVEYAHGHNVCVYVACNIYPRTSEQDAILAYLKEIGSIGPDALIIADPGIFSQAYQVIPEIPIHLSTQANTTSCNAVLFWENIGVKRVNVARELSLEEIKEIVAGTTLEIEAFVHGAMCISYSGRCLLSTFMSKRDSNRGMCSHPCRWKYSVVEALRPGQYMPVFEDDRGTYVFNSKDLCMIEYIPDLIEAGIASLKIEGRMKGINYLASTVKVYREAIDSYYAHPESFETKDEWIKELASISNRVYCTGFYFNDPDQISPNYTNHKPLVGHRFVGKVIKKCDKGQMEIEVRNKIFNGDAIEIVGRKGPPVKDKIKEIVDLKGEQLPFAQPNSIVTIVLNNECSPNDLIRSIEDP